MSPRNADYDVRGPDVPRDLFDDGRVRFSLGVAKGKRASERRALIHKHLRLNQEWEVLRAIVDGVVGVHDVTRVLGRHGETGIGEVRGLVERQRAGKADTIEAATVTFLKSYVAAGRSPQSVKSTASRLARVAEQTVRTRTGEDVPFGSLRLDEIEKSQVEQAVRAVSDNASTQTNAYAALSALFSWAAETEEEVARVSNRTARLVVNPVRKVRLPKPTRRTMTASTEQVTAMLAAGQLYQQVYVRVFVQIGLRLGELAHTRMHHDFDHETWLWRIQGRPKDPRCGCPQCKSPKGWSPKSARGVRTFRVPEHQSELREALDAWIEVTKPEPGDFLFVRPGTKQPWSNRALADDFAALCEAAGVRYGRKVPGGITIHDLRHTAATELVRAGVRESVIAALLGDTVEEIVKTYVNLNSDDLAEGIARSPSYG